MKLKDVLISTLGVVGYILWFIIGALSMFTPLVFLEFPFWIDLILIVIITYFHGIGDIIDFILWIWSFIVVGSAPIDGWSIAYFIMFAIYVLTAIIPAAINIVASIISIIASLFNNKSHY